MRTVAEGFPAARYLKQKLHMSTTEAQMHVTSLPFARASSETGSELRRGDKPHLLMEEAA